MRCSTLTQTHKRKQTKKKKKRETTKAMRTSLGINTDQQGNLKRKKEFPRIYCKNRLLVDNDTGCGHSLYPLFIGSS